MYVRCLRERQKTLRQFKLGKYKELEYLKSKGPMSQLKEDSYYCKTMAVGNHARTKLSYWRSRNEGRGKGSEDVLTELLRWWLQDKDSDKGSEEDVLTELSHRWLQDEGSGKGS